MLLLVQEYGLSHVCANSEFKNIEDFGSNSSFLNLNYPYLDIYFKKSDVHGNIYQTFEIEFYFRGTKHQELKFENLLEYLLWTSLHGAVVLNRIDLLIFRIKVESNFSSILTINVQAKCDQNLHISPALFKDFLI